LGHRYATASDTESIVHAYEEYGFDCVKHLDGMFAFVLYDRTRRLLFGARDRLGKKPLYYTTRLFGEGANAVSFAFASEIKALRCHPAIRSGLSISNAGLISYLLNDYVLGEQSIYEGIGRLPAGCTFVHGLPGSKLEGFRQSRYWDIHVGPSAARSEAEPSLDEAADRVLALLEDAVRRRLMSDVPLGTFLSGGIDSSSVVAMLTRLLPAKQIKTFAIGFDEPSFDESAYARQVARRFGTDHYARRFTASDLLERVPHVARMLDEPFADPSILPVSMLCEFARQVVTVALGGDGGDELFAGYDPFRAVGPARWYGRLVPRLVHEKVAVPLASLLPASDANMSLQFRVGRFLRGALVEPARRLATWMGPFSVEQLERLVPDLRPLLDRKRAYESISAAYEHATRIGADPLDPALDYFERFYLPDDILVKLDRASMMHSLEARSPFLDTALVEYVNRLPGHMKLRRGTAKFLLKYALTGGRHGKPVVDSEIVQRRKKGFGIPVARWLRHELRDQFRQALLVDWPRELGMFNRPEIERLLDGHQFGGENNYKELWALYMLALWARFQAA
jgi:asparagine synthase (glutamine-hydrolysing)